jgi:Trp operon repressor
MEGELIKLIVGAAFGLTLLSSGAMAACTSYPYTLANGSTADASQVMANFNCAAKTGGSTLDGTTFTGTSAFSGATNLNGTNTLSPNTTVTGASTMFTVASTSNGASDDIKFSSKNSTGTSNIWTVGPNITQDNAFQIANGTSPTVLLNVLSSGNVGIGASSPLFPLQIDGASTSVQIRMGRTVSSAGYFDFGVDSAGYVVYPNGYTSGAPKFYINMNGNVGVGVATPSYTLHVNGSVAGTSAYNNLSDARLKKDVREISNGIALIERMRGVRYNWRSPEERTIGKELKVDLNKPQVGFIAQELGKVLPEAVTRGADKDQTLTVAESKVVPVLVEAVKELVRKNGAQAEIIANMNDRIAVLERGKHIKTAER